MKSKKFRVEILNYTDEDEFGDAFKIRLDDGYTLGGTNAYFDGQGQQYFYAVFYHGVAQPIKSAPLDKSTIQGLQD